MSEIEDGFVRGILEEFPVFRADLDGLLASYEARNAGGSVPHPTSSRFLLALAVNVVDRYREGGSAEAAQFRGLLGYLEAQFGRDPEIDELIATRFLELMPERDERIM